ncbi:ABC transporter ATP-binding protein [Candidatus Acetothermia bacterium]|jgi:putative ABC transport system ATP-binding protein|nr:ABC transporter ATP-binding protein [Candidatus Acetothermia bacterium]MCI2427368.1 ABC transporter ATP-binding protein [Candidatus Acetothermia bacterium]MCI2428705.1 ABC transporter ATP-binding protein [Candidatus Acetothermia bacterium]
MNDIYARNIHKHYDNGRIRALNGVNLDIANGEFVALMGPSGCGKSTLLHMVGGLDKPDLGKLVVADQDLIKTRDLTSFRARTVGFVFQLHNLLPSLTAIENVMIPMHEIRQSESSRRKRALELLDKVGISKRVSGLPSQLSGGERQRVAIARALANSPPIILADEPTGNLDSKNGEQIMALLTQIWKTDGTTLLIITHDMSVAQRAQRMLYMRDGELSNNLPHSLCDDTGSAISFGGCFPGTKRDSERDIEVRS